MICSAPFSVTVVNDSHIFLLWGKYIINCIHFAKVLQENSLGTTVDLTDKSLEGYLDEGRGGKPSDPSGLSSSPSLPLDGKLVFRRFHPAPTLLSKYVVGWSPQQEAR